MPRTVTIAQAAAYAKPATTLSHTLKITRSIDSLSFGYTTLDRSIVVDGFTYDSGLVTSAMQSTSGPTVGNLHVNVFPDEVFNAADLLAGLWNGAVFVLGIVDWTNPANGIDIIKVGTTGEAELNEQGFWKLEFRGLMQAYQQSLGEVTQKTCKNDLGDERCRVVLTPFTHTRTVSATVSAHSFQATDAAGEATDYYGEGFITWLTGANAPLSFKVRDFTVASGHGIFMMSVAMPFTIAIGDTFTAVAGCRKRHDRTTDNMAGLSDCLDKFDNVFNFGGEPHVPGQDKLLADPELG